MRATITVICILLMASASFADVPPDRKDGTAYATGVEITIEDALKMIQQQQEQEQKNKQANPEQTDKQSDQEGGNAK